MTGPGLGEGGPVVEAEVQGGEVQAEGLSTGATVGDAAARLEQRLRELSLAKRVADGLITAVDGVSSVEDGLTGEGGGIEARRQAYLDSIMENIGGVMDEVVERVARAAETIPVAAVSNRMANKRRERGWNETLDPAETC